MVAALNQWAGRPRGHAATVTVCGGDSDTQRQSNTSCWWVPEPRVRAHSHWTRRQAELTATHEGLSDGQIHGLLSAEAPDLSQTNGQNQQDQHNAG